MSTSSVKRLAKNSAYLYVLTFSNYFIGLLIYPYLSRVLSVEGFGLIGFSMSFVMIFQIIVEFGFMISATATISKCREDTSKISMIVSVTTFAKIALSLFSIAAFSVAAIFIPMLRESFCIIFLFLLSGIFVALLPDFFFRGIEQMKTISIRTVLIRLLALGLILVFVKNDSQIILVPVSYLLSNIVAMVVTFVAMRKTGIKLRSVRAKEVAASIKEGSFFFFSRLAVSVNKSFGAMVLGLKFAPSSLEMGIFSGASKLSEAGEMMVSPVSDSIYPHMINKKDYVLFRKVVTFGGVIWFLGCVGVFVLARPLCSLILGSDFAAAGDYLRILLFGNFMGFFSNLFGYPALSPIGKAKHANIPLIVSAIINAILYIILWATNAISVVSVCVVIALTNLFVFGYRGIILAVNRDKIR